MREDVLEYAGFWVRVWASAIDTLLVMIVAVPLLVSIYGRGYFFTEALGLVAGPADFLVSWVFPAVVIILFWIQKQATPGKMAISAKIVDARTGVAPNAKQLIWRYFAYFIAALPLGLGLLWVAFDAKKQGWHDKLAGTVVIRKAKRGPEPVRFEKV